MNTMKTKKLILLLMLFFACNSLIAQFNFHWAFPYYAYKNMEVKNGNKDILVLTKAADYNGFKKQESKHWGKSNDFHYAQSVNGLTKKNYMYICTDGTISSDDIQKLHKNIPKNVVFFVHRTKVQWPTDQEFLKKMLMERPGWAYGGDPYNPQTTIIRSPSSVFAHKNIVLHKDAPGEGM